MHICLCISLQVGTLSCPSNRRPVITCARYSNKLYIHIIIITVIINSSYFDKHGHRSNNSAVLRIRERVSSGHVLKAGYYQPTCCEIFDPPRGRGWGCGWRRACEGRRIRWYNSTNSSSSRRIDLHYSGASSVVQFTATASSASSSSTSTSNARRRSSRAVKRKQGANKHAALAAGYGLWGTLDATPKTLSMASRCWWPCIPHSCCHWLKERCLTVAMAVSGIAYVPCQHHISLYFSAEPPFP